MDAQVTSPLPAARWTRLRTGSAIARLLVLALITQSIVLSDLNHGVGARRVLSLVLTGISAAGWLIWTSTGNHLTSGQLWSRDSDLRMPSQRITLTAVIMMGAFGGVLAGLDPKSLALVFPAAAAAVVGVRFGLLPGASMAIAIVVVTVVANVGFGDVQALGLVGAVAGMYAVGSGRRAYVLRAIQAEQLLAETRRANAEQAHAATLAERTRIAREIHDVLAHSLAALSVQLEAADALLSEGHDPARAHEYVGHAQHIAREGLIETRRAIAALREDAPPLPDLVRTLAKSYETDTGASADLVVTGTPRPLGPDVALALYRTAQEAFTNIRKHAPRAEVVCELTYEDAAAELTVRNTLAPGGAASIGGYGLTGMRERATLLGGALIAGADDDDWRVTVRVPYRTGEAA